MTDSIGLVRRFFYIYLLLFFNNAFGKNSAEILLPADTTQVLAIKYYGKDLSVDITADGKPYLSVASTVPFQLREYVKVGPFNEPTLIAVLLRDQIDDNQIFTLNAEPLALSSSELNLFTKVFEQTVASEMHPPQVEALFQSEPFNALSPGFRNYFVRKFSRIALNAGNVSQSKQYMAQIRENPEQALVAHCYLVEALGAKAQHIDYLESLAQVARSMVELFRHQGNIPSVSDDGFSRLTYLQACQIPVSMISADGDGRNRVMKAGWSFLSEASEIFDHALGLVPADNSDVLASILAHQWYLHNAQDQHLQAQNVIRQAIYLTEQNQPAISRPPGYYQLMFSSLMRQGLVSEAGRYLGKVMEFRDDLDSLTLAVLFHNRGFLYRELGEWELAIRSFTQSIEAALNQPVGSFKIEAKDCFHPSSFNVFYVTSLNQLASTLRHTGDTASALHHHLCAADLVESSGTYYELTVLEELAKDYIVVEDYASAYRLGERILSDPRVRKPQVISALTIQLNSLIAQQRFEAAQEIAVRLAQAFGYEALYLSEMQQVSNEQYFLRQIEFFRQLVELHRLTDREQWVHRFADKAMSLIRDKQYQVNNPQAWREAQFRFIETYLASIFDNEKTISDAIQVKLFGILEEFYSLELRREHNLYNANYQESLVQTEQSQRFEEWMALERRIIDSQGSQREVLSRKLDRAKESFLTYQISSEARGSNSRQVMSIEQIQATMAEDEMYLRYILNDSVSVQLVLTKEQFYVRPLSAPKETVGLVGSYIQSVKTGKIRTIANSPIPSILLPPKLKKSHQYKRLVITADNVLHKLPFATLNVAQNDNRYVPLINDVEIVLTQSASHFYSEESDNKVSTPNILISVFADPDFGPLDTAPTNPYRNYKRLPATEFEAQTIKQIFPPEQARFGLGREATNHFLMDERTRSSTILHIATHGFFDPSLPDVVGLLTSETINNRQVRTGLLSLSELLSQPLDSDLVVISGCDTMQGKLYKGSGMRSLTRGFITQGAGSVIGTLWPVTDWSTARFMEKFYQNLSRNDGKTADALRKTQIEFLQQGRYKNPLYWAGFVLTSLNAEYLELELGITGQETTHDESL